MGKAIFGIALSRVMSWPSGVIDPAHAWIRLVGTWEIPIAGEGEPLPEKGADHKSGGEAMGKSDATVVVMKRANRIEIIDDGVRGAKGCGGKEES